MDGIILNKIVQELNQEAPYSINKIYATQNNEIIFQTYNGNPVHIKVVTDSKNARIQKSKIIRKTKTEGNHFIMILRHHILNGRINKIEQMGHDRVIRLKISKKDELGVLHDFNLYIEFLGRFNNIILTDKLNIIIDSLKRKANFEGNQRIILPKQKYSLPKSVQTKNYLQLQMDDFTNGHNLRKDYQGISSLLENELRFRLENDEKLPDIIKEIKDSHQVFLYTNNYHIIPLKHLKEEFSSYPIATGLDIFYKNRDETQWIKENGQHIRSIMKREIKKEKRRLVNLRNDFKKAKESDKFKEYADLIYTYHPDSKAGLKEVTVTDFNNKRLVIPLQEELTAPENAQNYYKRYQKAQRSFQFIEKEKEKAKQRLDYYQHVLYQTENADSETLLEIKVELEKAKIIQTNKKTNRKIKFKNPYRIFKFDDNNLIYIGKNNRQNEEISFKVASKDDLWFHAAHSPGAHVVLKSKDSKKEAILAAANCAAYFSKRKYETKAEVFYTKAKNLKKIKSAPLGAVQISNEKSLLANPFDPWIAKQIKK